MNMRLDAPVQLRDLIAHEIHDLRRRINGLENLLNEIKFEQQNDKKQEDYHG